MLRIYTDGSCEGNPGKGGWAALILGGDAPKVLSGYERRTTSNRMEQTAAIKGLEAAPRGAQVTVYSDSRYLVATMTRGWKRNRQPGPLGAAGRAGGLPPRPMGGGAGPRRPPGE